MKWLPTLCKNCIAKLWMVGIIAIVFVALTVSAVRATLPYLNQYQSQVSQYLFDHYKINLSMQSVKGYWHNGGPLLVFDDLDFDNQEALGIAVTAPSVKLHIDLLETVLSLSVRFKRIEIESPVINIGDLSSNSTDEKIEEDIVLTPLLSLSQFVSITDATIAFSEHYGELPNVNIAKVAWHDDFNRRQLQLSLTNKLKQQPLSVIVDISGETLNTLHGQAYIKANEWTWLENLKLFLPQIKENATAVASFEFWADFSTNQIDSMILAMGDNSIHWLENNSSNVLTLTPELIQWLPNNNGWLFEAKDLKLTLNDNKLTPIHIHANQSLNRLNATISSINIGELIPIGSLMSVVDNELSSLLSNLDISGFINELSISHENKQWSYQGHFNGISMEYANGIPGVENVNGSLEGIGDNGELSLSINNKALDFGPHFKAPINIHHLESTIRWDITPNEIHISSPKTVINNNDIVSQLSWKISFNDSSSPQLSLLGGAQVTDAKRVANYLPHKILGDELVDYLSDAIQSGSSNDVAMLWRGELGTFPYSNHDGAFEVTARLKDATFKFDKEWQALTNADVDLQFKNESMVIEGVKGQLGTLNFENLTIGIDNLLKKPVLSIQTRIIESQPRIDEFVFGSPLDDSLGAVLRQLDVTGIVDTSLDIQLPFEGEQSALVSGSVKLNENNVLIKPIEVDVEKIKGDIKFINGDISTSVLTGVLYEQPIEMTLNCRSIGDVYGVDIDLAANWHTNKMPKVWQQSLSPYLEGSLDWTGQITLKISEESLTYQANILSPMKGLKLNLPNPLNKSAEREENLVITSNGNVDGSLFKLALGSRAEIAAYIDTKQAQVSIPAMTLIVGRKFTEQDEMATQGVSLNIDLDSLAVNDWNNLISNLEKGESNNNFFPELQQINAQIKQLDVFDFNFNVATLNGHKTDGFWEFNLDSTETKGNVKIFDNFMVKGIEANLERLSIEKPSQKESGNNVAQTREWLRDLPPIAFHCQQCEIFDVKLGKVNFITRSHLQGLEINDISVRANATSLNADIIWGFDTLGEYTNVTGTFNSDNIELTLGLLDYTSSIRDSDVDTDFNVMWRDNIYSPDLETLSGDVAWEFGEGHIAEVSDQGARIFSLFSLDSLRRKLVLDFRDVFQEGIFFNDFKGDFEIKNGVAVTTNAYMDGVAGGVDVVGSVNLSTQELDYYISFAPRLFSNLPVLAGVVASQPQVFVLTFAITKVLEPIVDVISKVNFKLSGNVENPDFKEIDRKQKKYKVPLHILEKAGIVIPPIEEKVEVTTEKNKETSVKTNIEPTVDTDIESVTDKPTVKPNVEVNKP